MYDPFTGLPAVSMKPKSTFGPATRGITLVHLDSPATTVMTDFAFVTPVTTTPQTPIDTALKKMKMAGVRLLFVVNDIEEIIGLITATDILGQRPIKVTQQTRLQRSKITVASIMTPQSDIQVLDAARVNMAMVGDIVATLHAIGRQHALVAQMDFASRTHNVIGMFSTSHISKLLCADMVQNPSPDYSLAAPAYSLAEIVEKMG